MWSVMLSVAWAQDPEVVDRGVERGDFDGSGRLDHALLYIMSDGSFTIEVVLDVPERDLLLPVSSSDPERAIEVLDVDGDRLDDLVITVGREVYSLTSSDRGWLPEGAGSGGGDLEPDYTIQLQNIFDDPFTFPNSPWPTFCFNICERWVVIISDCGPFPCFNWVCSQWETYCSVE